MVRDLINLRRIVIPFTLLKEPRIVRHRGAISFGTIKVCQFHLGQSHLGPKIIVQGVLAIRGFVFRRFAIRGSLKP